MDAGDEKEKDETTGTMMGEEKENEFWPAAQRRWPAGRDHHPFKKGDDGVDVGEAKK